MSNIHVSIFIPVFNYSMYLPTCLESIINQSLKNIEIILINHSENNINELINLYANTFDNIKIINSDKYDSKIDLNSYLNIASGKYVSFIDSNDYVKLSMFEKLFDLSEINDLDIAMCKVVSMDDFTNYCDIDLFDCSLSIFNNFEKKIFGHEDILNFITDIYSKSHNKLFKKSFLIKNNINFPDMLFGEEVFFYDTFLNAEKISILDEYLYVHRINNQFIKNTDNYSEIIHSFLLIRNRFIEKNLWDTYKINLYNYFIKLILYYFELTSNDYKENFFNTFKKYLQNILIKDNISCCLNRNYILKIKHFIDSKDFFEFSNVKKAFSVVIPCYNVEDYIENCINSVINQTLDFNNFIEIILVDIGSTDNTINICNHYVEKYPNNIKFLNCENQSLENAKNHALKHISGKYVNFLDADDILMEDDLSNNFNFFEENNTEISISDMQPYFYRKSDSETVNSYEKIFSVVISCYNVENYLDEAVNSIINQTLDFEKYIEIILVDDGSTDNTKNICKKFVKKYPNNIKYLHQLNQGQASARNFGLKYISGKYVNFLDADDTLMEDTFINIYEFFEEHYFDIDLVAFPMYFFEKKSGNHSLNYKFKKNLIVKLDGYWDYPQLSASSAVFKSILFDDFTFDTNLISSEDAVMVNKILLEKRAYGVISSGGYNYRKRSDVSSTIDSSIYDKRYYIGRLKGYFRELIDYSKFKLGFVPKFIQYLIIYDIKWIFLDGDVQSLLDDDELMEFNKHLRYIFANIEREVIEFHFKDNYDNMKFFFFNIKYDKIYIKNSEGFVHLTANNQILDTLNNHKFYIDIVEIKDNTLFISGLLLFNTFFNKKDLDIVILKTSNNIDKTYYPNYRRYSNRINSKFSKLKFSVDFEVPLTLIYKSKVQINLIYRIGDENIIINPSVVFFNHASMSEICNYSIWNEYFIEFENNSFFISKYNYIKFLKKEVSILRRIFKIKGPYWTSAICFHFVYLVLFIFYSKKSIWLVMDRQERADDNAEHFFRYCNNINDGINKYFVILKNSEDYFRLCSEWKNLLIFYSIKHRILYLFSDKIISSQADDEVFNPFKGKNIKFYSGLFTADKIFLQHGVAKDDMSNWLKKYDKNVKLIVTTADIEAKSFKDYNYNYNDGVVQVLGLPRYDNLYNESDNKQILIMPTWRRSLIHSNKYQIKKSEYFLRFNSLINNKKLINLAKSFGYSIIFKPHPNTLKFLDLFDINDYVIIDKYDKYQDLFNNSSLLITDYSSLAFDFAYIKKPIIYYQYSDDYHFHNNFFIYETMGFGEVITDENDLISLIGEYLNNDCKIKDIYLERSNSFYKFNDKNNCKRVYNAIKKIK